METSAESELTDLQRALRKHRPGEHGGDKESNFILQIADYIAAAEERAGRLSRQPAIVPERVLPESRLRRPAAVRRSQSSPRVSSILKPSASSGSLTGPPRPAVPRPAPRLPVKVKKSVTILPNG